MAPGTTTEITPTVPGTVSPGEAVELRGTFSFTGIGSIQTDPATGFSGPIVGFATALFAFEAGMNHGGAFYGPVTRDPGLPGAPDITPGRVAGIRIGQFGMPGGALAVHQHHLPQHGADSLGSCEL